MCAIIGSFDFNKIIEGLPRANERGGTAWSLTRILTNMRASCIDIASKEGKPTEQDLNSLYVDDTSLSELKKLQVSNGEKPFNNSKTTVYYVLHVQTKTSKSSESHPDIITTDEQKYGQTLFWHNGIITSKQMKSWNEQDSFDSHVIHKRLHEEVMETNFQNPDVDTLENWYNIDGTIAFLSFMKGRILFGRNSGGILWQEGTTLSTVAFCENMQKVEPGYVFLLEDTNIIRKRFDFTQSTLYV